MDRNNNFIYLFVINQEMKTIKTYTFVQKCRYTHAYRCDYLF